MAKRIPRHIPSLPDPTPVRGGQIIKSQASPISMDTSIMANDLGNGNFEIADDRFGLDCCCGSLIGCDHCCSPGHGAPFSCCEPSSSKDSNKNQDDYTLTGLIIKTNIYDDKGNTSDSLIMQTTDINLSNECDRSKLSADLPLHVIYNRHDVTFGDFNCESDSEAGWSWKRSVDHPGECFVSCQCCGGNMPPQPTCHLSGEHCDHCLESALASYFDCDNSGCARTCAFVNMDLDTSSWCLEYDESWSYTFTKNSPNTCIGQEFGGFLHVDFSYAFTIKRNVMPCKNGCTKCQ